MNDQATPSMLLAQAQWTAVAVALVLALALALALVRARHKHNAQLRAEVTAESALATREGRRVAMALDAADLGAWEWNCDSDKLEGRRVAALFGVAADADLTRSLWAQSVHPDDRDEWEASSRRSLAEQRPWLLEHRIIRPDGLTRWLEARGEPMIDATGVAFGMVGVIADVTSSREALAASAEATAMTVRMVDSLQILAKATTESAVHTVACELATKLFGSDSASIWDARSNPAVLMCRVPVGNLPPGTAAAIDQVFAPTAAVGTAAQSTFVTREQAVGLSSAAGSPGAPAAGVATPIRIAGEVVAYLALGWVEPRRPPAAAWLAVVDRFAVNVAVALSVVRRQTATEEVQRLTHRLQNGLLPTPIKVPSPMQAATIYRPGERRLMLGGDFMDLIPHGDGRLSFVVGDVAGHGPEQAALGTILRSAWAGLASSGDLDPSRWATVLHEMLVRRREDESTFVTAAMGVLDPRARTLTYLLAGHPPPLQLVPIVTELAMPEAPPLGMLTRPVEAVQIDLPEDFGLFVFTDGLYDGFDSTGVRLGFDGLKSLVAARTELRTRSQLSALVNQVERLNGGPLADDVAALLLVHGGPADGIDALAVRTA